MMKKITAVIVALLLAFALTFWQSRDLRKAKELIDEIYKDTNELTLLQLEQARGSDDVTLPRRIGMCEKFIEAETIVLLNVYEGLSDREKQEVDNYVAEAGKRNIDAIWD